MTSTLNMEPYFARLQAVDPITEFGVVDKIVGNSIESHGPNATVGSVCWLTDGQRRFPVEVVGFSGGNKYLFPGISGPDLLDALKASRVTSGIPVVVVTAEEEEGRRAAMQAGADDYLTKPFSPRALVRTVEQVLEGSEPTGG